MFGSKERRVALRTEEQANTKARRISVFLLTLALPALIVALTYRFQFRQLTDTNVMEMGQIARNLMEGKGFATSTVRPLQVAIESKPDLMEMKDVIHAPLYPIVLAVTLAMGGAEKRLFLTSVLFFFLTIPVLLALSRAMFNQKVAYFTLFVYAINTVVITTLVQAGTGTLLAFLFTALCLALFRYAEAATQIEAAAPDPRRIRRLAMWAGLLTALCYLTEYMYLFILIPVILMVWLTGGAHRRKGLGAFLLAFIIPAGLWWLRNLIVGVNPFFGLRILEMGMGTKDFPGMSLYRSMTPQTTLGLLQQVKMELLKKMAVGLLAAYQNLVNMGAPYLMAFLVAGLFYSFRRPGVNAVRSFVLVSFVFVMLFASLFFAPTSTVLGFLPVLLAFATAFLVRLITDARLPTSGERLVMSIAVIVVSLPTVYRFTLYRPAPNVSHSAEALVGRVVASRVPILTDRPAELAWYSGRTAIWLPLTEPDVQKLDTTVRQSAILLSGALTNYPGADFDIWKGLYLNAAQGLRNPNGPQFMKIKGKTMDGFALFQDMTPDETQSMLQENYLLFLRPDTVRKQ